MKYWPDISSYDSNNINGLAQYMAHCEFDPIGGLIEQMNLYISATSSFYHEQNLQAIEIGDDYSQCEYSNLQGIFNYRIVPLAYESIILIMISKLEETFNGWCRMISYDHPEQDFESYKCNDKGALEKAINYLKNVGKIDGIKQDKKWAQVKAYRDARNMIVHNGGRVPERLRDEMRNFNIGMREEDFGLYIDKETIEIAYKTIVQFIDNVYAITPLDE